MASIQQRKRNRHRPWAVQWRTPEGKHAEKAFASHSEAKRFLAGLEHELASGTYIDRDQGSIGFAGYAATVVAGMDVSTNTRKLYQGILRAWIAPWAGTRTLAQVTADREGAGKLINDTMRASDGRLLSYNRRGTARSLIEATAEEAVAAGRIRSHRLTKIRLVRGEDAEVVQDRADFVFPSYGQVSALAGSLNGFGLAVWLMRGCGLRAREALGVERSDFREHGKILRVSGQASLDGRRKEVLKHRTPGQCREVPVPEWLWKMVRSLGPGPVVPGSGARYVTYNVMEKAFRRERDRAGIPAQFTMHSLRHAFVSALLSEGVPITDIAKWLGHSTIEVTYRTYGHLVPSAAGRARTALDAEFARWRDGGSEAAAA